MTLDLLDILLVCHFVFDKPVPWPMWVVGVLATIGAQLRMKQLVNKK